MPRYGVTDPGPSEHIVQPLGGGGAVTQRADQIEVGVNGWITELGVLALGNGGLSTVRLLLYDGAGPLRYQSEAFDISGAVGWRLRALPNLRVRGGAAVDVGLLTASTSPRATLIRGYGGGAHLYSGASAVIQNSANLVAAAGTLNAYVDVRANVAPTVGRFVDPTPAGEIKTNRPSFRGVGAHANGDSDLCYTSLVHLQIVDTSPGGAGGIIHDQVYDAAQISVHAAGPGPGRNEWLVEQPVTLAVGRLYAVRFRHADSFGVWSGWTLDRDFSVASGPLPPDPIAPAGKIDAVSGFAYRAGHDHARGFAAASVELEVWNAEATRRVFPPPPGSVGGQEGGFVADLVPDAPVDTAFSVPEWHENLAWATGYSWRARVTDPEGLVGPWSRFQSFRTNAAPSSPSGLTPSGNRKLDTGEFACLLSDPDDEPVDGAFMELVDATTGAYVRSALPWDSLTPIAAGDARRPTAPNNRRYVADTAGTTSPRQPAFSVVTGSTVRDNGGAAAVARSAAYALHATVIGPAGTPAADLSLYYRCTTAGTTAASGATPAYPTDPGSSVTDGTAVFRCERAVVWREAGSDQFFNMAVDAPSGGTSAALTIPAEFFVMNRAYRWRAWANDGVLTSAPSAYASFIFASAPIVELLAPAPTRENLAADPSAEHPIPQGLPGYWTEEGRNEAAGNLIERVRDGNAASGVGCWRATGSAGLSTEYRGALHTVDHTKSYLVVAEMRKESGAAPRAKIRLFCYDANLAFIAAVSPRSVGDLDSLAGLAAGEMPTTWARYGGVVWPEGHALAPAMPAGTRFARVVLNPTWQPEAASVARFDAVVFERAPFASATVPLAPGELADAQAWYGYFDGDEVGFAGDEEDRYLWRENPGASSSTGVAVLTRPAPRVRISYRSRVRNPKKDDRLLVDFWNGEEWKSVHAPPFKASQEFAIAIPAGVLRNEGRYRMQAQVRDSENNVGETEWAEFDVRYAGPPERNILSVETDPDRAAIRITFEAANMPAVEFAAVEIARKAPGEPLAIVLRSGDPQITGYEYHFPVSGREYEIMVRQVRSAGPEEVQGRWSSVAASVDYRGRMFLKSVAEPGRLLSGFNCPKGSRPTGKRGRRQTRHEIRGLPDPVFFVGAEKRAPGAAEAVFVDGTGFALTASERAAALSAVVEEWPTVCVLDGLNGEKVFATLSEEGVDLSTAQGRAPGEPIRYAALAWERSSYSEDYYEREGLR